jgi:hypothetical protein
MRGLLLPSKSGNTVRLHTGNEAIGSQDNAVFRPPSFVGWVAHPLRFAAGTTCACANRRLTSWTRLRQANAPLSAACLLRDQILTIIDSVRIMEQS